jgi:hypothetical protein
MQNSVSLKKAIRIWITIFIIALVLKGVTAFALETELTWLNFFKRRRAYNRQLYVEVIFFHKALERKK